MTSGEDDHAIATMPKGNVIGTRNVDMEYNHSRKQCRVISKKLDAYVNNSVNLILRLYQIKNPKTGSAHSIQDPFENNSYLAKSESTNTAR